LTGDPFVVVQLSDPHIGAAWDGADPAAMLADAVEHVRRLDPAPAAVIVAGDIAENGTNAEYELARELLAPLGAPLHALPGNHDDRAALRRHFGLPGAGGAPVQYAVELGPLRLVVVDSVRPGEHRGELDGGRLAWLDAELAAAPDVPTVVAMHHPPLLCGIPGLDAIATPAAERSALAAILERHPQVQRVVAGHLHRTVAGSLGGRAVLAAPSTYLQLALDFRSDEIGPAGDPPGFALHVLYDGGLVSHVVAVTADRTR
jgi:3',5'-cyclic-AMP phosphodiesterase